MIIGSSFNLPTTSSSRMFIKTYGKPEDYSMKNVHNNKKKEELIRAAFSSIDGVRRFYSPIPGTKGTFAKKQDFKLLDNFRNLFRGVNGDICQIEEGEAYVVSAADCLVGFVTLSNDKTFAFHAGWQEILGVSSFLKQQIDEAYLETSSRDVRACFGFAAAPKFLSLKDMKDANSDLVKEVLKKAEKLGAKQKGKSGDHVDLLLMLEMYLKNICELSFLPLFSNTALPEEFWSHRLDKGAGYNLVVIGRQR